MNTLPTPEDLKKVAKLCKDNPLKAMKYAEIIFRELQMVTIPEFAKLSILSERTLYNYVADPENAKMEFYIFCNEKHVSAKLNKHLLRKS